ncbi:MAG: hypothetical protein ACHBN1_07205 [Heteroscytonema crispum UTEX LB 1556]
MKKRRLPIWFPYASSWLSALMLSVVMAGFVSIIKRNSSGLLLKLVKSLANPEQLTILLILFLILPIPAIAFFHHFFLGRFIPIIPGVRISKTQGFLPGVISWWESLYSWLVVVLSTLIATLFCTPFLPLFQLSYQKLIFTYNQPHTAIQVLFAVVWLFNAAIFYQVEYLFKRRLISDDSDISLENTNQNSTVEVEAENKPVESGVTEVQINGESPTVKPTQPSFFEKNRNLPKKILIAILIPLVGAWLYLFANLPEVKEEIPASFSFQKLLTTSLETENNSQTPKSSPKSEVVTVDSPVPASPKIDTFDKAVETASTADKLSKLAQSPEEWKQVARNWRKAIALMQAVPDSSSNYILAQHKIREYKLYLDFAQQYAPDDKEGR